MPEYLAPGVYVEEVDMGSKPIEGVSTSTAGAVGMTERGPVDVPTLITSYGEFTRWFGDYLKVNDFNNANGAHCYLPHAIEGFFTNGGKRIYVTRVIDTGGATQARRFMYDRGTATSADTVILRAIDEQTGTAANPPLLYSLDVSDTSVGDWIRVGAGSNAEYRQVTDVDNPVNNTHVPLNFPLHFSHAITDTVNQFNRAEDLVANAGPYTAGFTLVDASEAADETILLLGAAADITVLDSAATTVLEIGGANLGEYLYVSEVTITSPTEARVRLAGSLTLAYDAAVGVVPIQLTPINVANLAIAPNTGARLIFVDDRNGDFDDRTSLVHIDNAADPTKQEVRRIGELYEIDVTTGAYETYSGGSLVEAVTLADDDRTLTVDPNIGDTTITLDDVSALSVGDSLLIGVLGSQETVLIQAVDTSTNIVTITPALTIDHGLNPVVPLAKTLTVDANIGSRVIALDNRLGLTEGDVIRLGDVPDDEYLTIDTIPNATGMAPDAGNLILVQGLVRSHATGDTVRRQNPPTTVALQATITVIDEAFDDTSFLVTDGNAYLQDMFIRLTTATAEVFYHRMASDASTVSPAEVTLSEAFTRAHVSGSRVAGRDPLFTVQALDVGAWGDRLRIAVADEANGLVSQTTVTAMVNPTNIRMASLAGVEVGTVLELSNPTTGVALDNPIKVIELERSESRVVLADPLTANQQNTLAMEGSLSVRSREFRVEVYLLRQPDPAMPSRNNNVIDFEVFRHLSMDPRHSRYLETVIGPIDGELRLSDRRPVGDSSYIRVLDSANTQTETEVVRLGPEALADVLPDGRAQAARMALRGGDDSIPTVNDNTYIGVDDREPENRTGLYSLKNKDNISIVAVPGRTSAQIQGALITHCELMRYRFAVLDGEVPPNDTLTDVQTQRQQFDTKYAALYHPWLLIPDPFPNNLAQVVDFPIPPSGSMLGVYARTDIERGVHKAPANEVVRGIVGLQRSLNKAEHDILNPSPVNINVIRDFRRDNRGIRVWGGRVITSDTDWKYVNVRRLLIFMEKSIDQGLQWVVFEPNAEPLWARVQRTISNFLTVVWRNGALEGSKLEQAFFVKCDRTTMTQTDIDNGRLICVIGVAPVKPAEYVIIRIGLWTANAES